MRKYVKFIVLGVSVTVIGLYMSTVYNPKAAEVEQVVVEEDNAFQEMLDEYNITVRGASLYLTKFQLNGLINMMDGSDETIIQRYTKKSEEAIEKIELTANEILELQYYSSSIEEQRKFLRDISNKVVDISGDGKGALLISY